MNKCLVKKLFQCYLPEYQPPTWILNDDIITDEHLQSTRVYYDKGASDYKELIRFREPTNIECDRLYNVDNLEKHFGYKKSKYKVKSSNVAIFCKTPVMISNNHIENSSDNIYRDINVINVIAPALDNTRQKDYMRLKSIKDINKRVDEYRKMLMSCFIKIKSCLMDKSLGFESLILHGFGMGHFSTYGPDLGIDCEKEFVKCFETTGLAKLGKNIFLNFIDFMNEYRDTDGITLMKKDIFNVIKKCDLSKTLIVNAWDCQSFVGNGNENDNSLDGVMGRISAMSVLCWSETNPEIKWIECCAELC